MNPVARTEVNVPTQPRDLYPNPEVNIRVITDRLSDHAIVIYKTALRTILSLNVMCSGEEHTGDANAFGIDPRKQGEDRSKRFQMLIDRLKETADKHPGCLIALQEYPRRIETGAEEFTKYLKEKFTNYEPYFGPVEQIFKAKQETLNLFERSQSQLCMLLPLEMKVKEVPVVDSGISNMGDTLASRMQVLRGKEEAFINLHLESLDFSIEDDVVLYIKEQCKKLIEPPSLSEEPCAVVYVVGDWNRRKKPKGETQSKEVSDWEKGWSTLLSPSPHSHVRGALVDYLVIPWQKSWPKDKKMEVKVEVNRAPIDRRLSNQGIIIYKMQGRGVLSLNMAVDQKTAKLLGVNIEDEKNRIELQKKLMKELKVSVAEDLECVIALQGCPLGRKDREVFESLLRDEFNNRVIHWELGSPLCMLAPEGFQMEKAFCEKNMQVIRSRSEAFVNVQLPEYERNRELSNIDTKCKELIKKFFTVVIGGWDVQNDPPIIDNGRKIWPPEWGQLVSPPFFTKVISGNKPVDHLAVMLRTGSITDANSGPYG